MEFLRFAIASCLFAVALSAQAQQQDGDYKYEHSSICMMMIEHPNLMFNQEIEFVFKKMAKPDRFNDHSLGVKVVKFADDGDQVKNIESFIRQVDFGKRCVARWFNRDKERGTFNVELLRERGYYDASALDVSLAMKSARGMAVLEDAGEKLIDNTYLVMNDIAYADKSITWQGVKVGLTLTTAIAAPFVIGDASKVINSGEGANWLYGELMDNIKGFRVNVTSYLFRLKWDEEAAARFYSEYYTDQKHYDQKKVKAWQEAKNLFVMEYVGQITNKSSKTVVSGVKTNEELIAKVCTRALDKNLADLQHKFADFRIKAPLVSTSPLTAYVGMKEDVTENSRFEVLERSLDDQGRINYKRVGVIRPVKDKVWDNRYMADREETPIAKLGATTFEIVSGSKFYPGMLIREIE